MRTKFSATIVLLFFSTIVASVPGCDDSIEFANTPPGDLTITKNICYLGPNDSVVLMGEAVDADGDSVSYSWYAEEGTLTPSDGKGQAVTWQAPGSHGTYRVTLRATDGLDDSSKGIDLDVGRTLDIFISGGVLDETDYPYIVPNALPLNIGNLITVTLEAGVTVVFNSTGGGLDVAGGLIVNGTEQDRVLFIPNKCPGEDKVWKGVKFRGSFASGNLNYLTIASSTDGLDAEDDCVVVADNIIVDQTSGEGISVENGADMTLSESRIWDNGSGIYVSYATLLVSDSSIRFNGNYGISMMASGSTAIEVTGCVVANNGQYGFVLAGSASPVVNGCSLFNNGPEIGGQMVLRTVMFIDSYSNTDPVDMTGNYWGTNDPLQIPPQIIRQGANGAVDYSGWLSAEPLGD